MQAAAVGTNCSNGTCSGTTAYSFSLSYAPNSNILSANDSANQNWNYSYDQLNRLACASVSSNTACAFPPTGTPTYTYVYDRFGNRLQQNSPAGGIYTSSLTFTGNGTTNNNRMDRYCYDSAGNLLDAGACPSSGPHQYVYDAENRLISSNYGASTYTYNAEGHRITKTTGGVTMTYTYDRDGHLFETYGQTNSLMENYVDGRHLGTWDWNSNYTGTIYHYTHADWLGTERARIDVSGNVCETITSLPFGDGMTTSGSCSDTSNMHFTGKERDSESGLDNFGARYDASNFGRFMSPDPDNASASIGAPQSWNAYSYVSNNPINYVDRWGLDCIYFSDSDPHSGWIKQGDCESDTDNGYYVDGNISGARYTDADHQIDLTTAGIGFDQNNNWAGYSYKASDTGLQMIGGQCIGDCPNQAVMVSAPIVPHIPTAIEEGQRFLAKYSYIFGPARFISAFTGIDPAYCGGPSTDDSAEHAPEQTDEEKTVNEGKQVKQSTDEHGNPIKKRPGRAPKGNVNGPDQAAAAGAAAEAVGLVNTGVQCGVNSRK